MVHSSDSFETAVSSCLKTCLENVSDKTGALGLAVSGGADSVSMLLSLHHILAPETKLYVITVNHNLRPQVETAGDAAFVQDLCKTLGVDCTRKDIPRGKIEQVALERDCGIEEAARFVRYEIFEAFIKEHSLCALCTAHTYSDHIETIVMRFLQGSGAEGLGGIPLVRERFIRPLRTVTRNDVEAYLARCNQTYCTDSTNADTAFLRNRVRSSVVPLLDSLFPGWQKSADSLSQKMSSDEQVLQTLTLEAEKTLTVSNVSDADTGCLTVDTAAFCRQMPAIRRRVLYRLLSPKTQERIPFGFIQDISSFADLCLSDGKKRSVSAAGLAVELSAKSICVQKVQKVVTESGFSAILYEGKTVSVGERQFCAEYEDVGVRKALRVTEITSGRSVTVYNADFPIGLRSFVSGDEICDAKGTMRSVSGILDGWKAGSKKQSVPLIQDLSHKDMNIVCIWGELCGLKNWVVA